MELDYLKDSSIYDRAKNVVNVDRNIRDWLLNGYGKAVGVITDKQRTICTEDAYGDFPIHENMSALLTSIIYGQQLSIYDEPRENVYWSTITARHNPTLVIYYDRFISSNQYTYMCKILDEVEEYNQAKNDQVHIMISNNKGGFFDTYDINEVKEKIKKDISYNKITHDKYIVGNTLSNEQIVENFHYRLKVKNITDLISTINDIRYNLTDEFYQNIVHQVFPHIDQIFELNDKLYNIFSYVDNRIDENIDLSNESNLINYLNNIIMQFINKIKSVFDDSSLSLDEKINIIPISSTVLNINEIYSNYEQFISFYNKYKDIFPNNLFDKCINYDDYFNTLFEYISKYLEKENIDLENNKQLLEKNIEKEKIGQNDGKYYNYGTEIKKFSFAISELQFQKEHNTEIISTNLEEKTKQKLLEERKSELVELQNQKAEKEEQINNTKGINKLLKMSSNVKLKNDINSIENRIKILEDAIKNLEKIIEELEEKKDKKLKEFDDDIKIFEEKLEEVKTQFKNEVSVSFEEYENEYLYHKVLPFELAEYNYQLERVNKKLEENIEELETIQNIIGIQNTK